MKNENFKLNYGLYTQKSALYIAAEQGNKEMVQLLLSNPNININMKCIIS